mgnify:CR=1 FL=1
MASQAASQAAGLGPPAASQPFAEIAEPSEAATLPSGPVLQGRVGGLRSAVIHIVPGEDHTVVSLLCIWHCQGLASRPQPLDH